MAQTTLCYKELEHASGSSKGKCGPRAPCGAGSPALRACLLGALAKLPGPGSELRRPILVAWGQDRCLGGVLPGRAASKQALNAPPCDKSF